MWLQFKGLTAGNSCKPYHCLWEIEHFITVLTSIPYNIPLYFICIDEKTQKSLKKNNAPCLNHMASEVQYLARSTYLVLQKVWASVQFSDMFTFTKVAMPFIVPIIVRERGRDQQFKTLCGREHELASDHVTVTVTAQSQWPKSHSWENIPYSVWKSCQKLTYHCCKQKSVCCCRFHLPMCQRMDLWEIARCSVVGHQDCLAVQ